MVANRFPAHSAHSSLENFHDLKQQSSVVEYILRFEQVMSLIQMDYLGLSE
jgi:tryptophan synthase alpha subunit